MTRLEAMQARRSTRKYLQQPLPAEQLAAIRQRIAEVPSLYEGHDLRVALIEEGSRVSAVMGGFVGSYGKPKAPHFILVTSAERDGWLENAGFAIEHLVLDLTAMGIGTCWIGGQAKRDVFLSADPTIPENHTPVVAISLGEPAGGLLSLVRTGRKAMAEIAPEGVGVFHDALEAARNAPSAGNTQPWRFFVDGDRVDVFAQFKTPLVYRSMADHLQLMNQVDVGVALAHFAIAEEAAGRGVRIAPEATSAREGLHYMTTVRRSA